MRYRLPTCPFFIHNTQNRTTRVVRGSFTPARPRSQLPHPPPRSAEWARVRKMRHSRRLSNHPNQPQGPYCSHCSVNLSSFPAYITCAHPSCATIPICVDCFSVGAADTFPHQPSHPYRVVEKLGHPVYSPDWAAHEEIRLLDALSEHGPHHWKAVADYVGKTQRKCELHYDNLYLKGPNAPLATSSLDQPAPTASPSVSADAIDECDVPDAKPGTEAPEQPGEERKLKDNTSESESGTLDGFMPLRGDFDVEWDDKAEELVSDLVMDPDDTAEERELKTKLLLMYDERLQRRDVVKEFLFDRKLLDFADLKYNDRRGTRDEKELSARLQVFSRLLSKPEFDAFYSSVMTEYRISRDVYRMAQARKEAGIRRKAELDVYEVERKARCQRLGEHSKGVGKERAVQKRRRSSTAVDSPAPTATPLNSVPGTPGNIVLSPAKPPPLDDAAAADEPMEPVSVHVRKVRERKRIAKSPYPLLEAMPVDDMEDAWKLSQTEKKLCSALRIPPAEFLRMRDAMLYTATQNVKRTDRSRRRTPNTPVLTIRAKRQGKGITKSAKKQVAAKPPEPILMLNTVPLSASHQQRVTLRQTNTSPTTQAVPRVTLSCKPPTNTDGVPVQAGLEKPILDKDEPTDEKLRVNLKVAPPEAQRPLKPAPAPTALTATTTAGLPDSDDLPLSATFPEQSESQKETKSPAAMGDTRTDTQNGPDVGESVTLDTKEDSREGTRDGTPESEVSCEEDIIHVTALDRPRPVTRSYARLSKRLRENVRTNLTRVSRSTSPIDGPKRAEMSCVHRTVLNITTLNVERPVTRSYAAQMHSSAENSISQPNTPTSEHIDTEGEESDLPTEPRADTARTEQSNQYRVPRKRSHYGRSKDGAPDEQRVELVNQEGQVSKLNNVKSGLVKSTKQPQGDVSSRDAVDEVLCGEDGAGDWSADTKEPRHVELGMVSDATNGKNSPQGSLDLANGRQARPVRNGSEADELLDQGHGSVDSTPARTSQRLAVKQPKTPTRSSQRLARKKPTTGERTSQRLARKRPRHLTETDSPEKRKRTTFPKRKLNQKDKDRDSKETEVTLDGDGECEGRSDMNAVSRKARRPDDADSVEILSGGEGEYSESVEKNEDEVEEVTLDEGQDGVAEDARDATWTPQESEVGDEGHDRSDRDDQNFDVSLEKPACQTELGTEPGTADTSFQDGEVQQFVKSKKMVGTRRRTGGTSRGREDLPAVRKSSRVQKRSRRLEESVEATQQPEKRRRTSVRQKNMRDISESPERIPATCTVITGQVGRGSLEDATVIEGEFHNVSQRFTTDTPRSKRKNSRQSTPSKSRYPTTERRVTRSAGRQTRSRSNNLRNRSFMDRISIRRG